MENKEFHFSLSKEGFKELLNKAPFKKIVYLFFIIGTLFISTSLYFYWIAAFRKSVNNPDEYQFQFVLALTLSIIMFLVPNIIFPFILKINFNMAAVKLLNRYQSREDEKFPVVFDEEQECFFVGRRRLEFLIDQSVTVYSTKKYLLIYQGYGKNNNKFYIPKEGNNKHKDNVLYLDKYFNENSRVKYIHKEKKSS